MTLRFGTDGVRGVANRELTSELVTALGRAAVRVLGHEQPFVVGRDTPYQNWQDVEKAVKEGKTLREVVLDEGLLSEEEVDRVLDVEAMTKGGIV